MCNDNYLYKIIKIIHLNTLFMINMAFFLTAHASYTLYEPSIAFRIDLDNVLERFSTSFGTAHAYYTAHT